MGWTYVKWVCDTKKLNWVSRVVCKSQQLVKTACYTARFSLLPSQDDVDCLLNQNIALWSSLHINYFDSVYIGAIKNNMFFQVSHIMIIPCSCSHYCRGKWRSEGMQLHFFKQSVTWTAFDNIKTVSGPPEKLTYWTKFGFF